MPALELLVERLQDAPCAFASLALALEGDMVSALVGADGKTPLDQREILSMTAEQARRQLVIVEFEEDLRLRVAAFAPRFGTAGSGIAQSGNSCGKRKRVRFIKCNRDELTKQTVRSCFHNTYGCHCSNQIHVSHCLYGLQIRTTSGDLTRQAAGLFEQDIEAPALHQFVEIMPLRLNQNF